MGKQEKKTTAKTKEQRPAGTGDKKLKGPDRPSV